MAKTYDPPLTVGAHGPLYRVDKAIKLAQPRRSLVLEKLSDSDLIKKLVRAFSFKLKLQRFIEIA